MQLYQELFKLWETGEPGDLNYICLSPDLRLGPGRHILIDSPQLYAEHAQNVRANIRMARGMSQDSVDRGMHERHWFLRTLNSRHTYLDDIEDAFEGSLASPGPADHFDQDLDDEEEVDQDIDDPPAYSNFAAQQVPLEDPGAPPSYSSLEGVEESAIFQGSDRERSELVSIWDGTSNDAYQPLLPIPPEADDVDSDQHNSGDEGTWMSGWDADTPGAHQPQLSESSGFNAPHYGH